MKNIIFWDAESIALIILSLKPTIDIQTTPNDLKWPQVSYRDLKT